MSTDVTLLRIRVETEGARAELDEYRRLIDEIRGNQDELADSARRVSSAFDDIDDVIEGVVGAFATLGLAMSASEFLEYADIAKNIESSLRLVTDGTEELTNAYEALKEVSLSTNTAFEDNVNLYSRLSTALGALGASGEEVIQITDTVARSLAISGASTQEASASMLQLSQAFSGLVLRGEEYNSVLEGNQRVIQLFADYLGVTVGQMRQLAEQGAITAEVMRDAFADQAQVVQEEFAERLQTVSGAWQNVRTETIDAVGALDRASGASGAVAQALLFVADNAEKIVNLGFAAAISLIAGGMAKLAANALTVFRTLGRFARLNPFTALIAAITTVIGLAFDLVGALDGVENAFERVANVAVGAWARISSTAGTVKAAVLELAEGTERYLDAQGETNEIAGKTISNWDLLKTVIGQTIPGLSSFNDELKENAIESIAAIELQGSSIRSMSTTWQNAMEGNVTATGNLAEQLKVVDAEAEKTKEAWREYAQNIVQGAEATKTATKETDNLQKKQKELRQVIEDFNEQVEFKTIADKLGLTEAGANEMAQAAERHSQVVQETADRNENIIDQLTATMGNVFADLLSGTEDWASSMNRTIAGIGASITGTLFGPEGLAGIDLGPTGNKIGASLVGGILSGLSGLGGVGEVVSGALSGALIGAQFGLPGAAIGGGLGLLSGALGGLFGSGGSGDNTFRIGFGGGGQGGPFGGVFSRQVTDVGSGLNQFLDSMNQLDEVFAEFATDREIAKLREFNEQWSSTTTRMLEGSFELNEALEMVAPRFGTMAASIENLAPFAADIERAFASGNVDQIRQVLSDIQGFSAAMEEFGISAAEAKDLLTGAQEGSESMLETFSRLYETMFSQEERRAMLLEEAQSRVEAFNDELGRTGERAIDTREELREYLQSLDLSRRGGRDAAQAALQLAEAIGLVEDASIEATEAAEAEAEARRKQIEAYNEALAAIVEEYTTALQPILDAMDTDLPSLYAEQVAAANQTAYQSALESAEGVRQLTAAFDGSLASAQALGAAVDSMTAQMLTAMAAAQRARVGVETDITGLIQHIEGSAEQPVQSTSDMLDQIIQEFENFQTLTDPDQIRQSVGEIEQFTRDLWNTLSPEQQGVHRDLFLDFLEEVGRQARNRIQEAEEKLAEEFKRAIEDAASKLAEQSDAMGAAADGMAAAAAGMNSAAAGMNAAVGAIPSEIDVGVSVRVDVVEIG